MVVVPRRDVEAFLRAADDACSAPRSSGSARELLSAPNVAPRKTTVTKKRRSNSATALLQQQHRKVETIFKELESGKEDPEPLVTELASDLAAHMHIEQELFYPRVREIDRDLVLESFEEHALAEIALKRLLTTDPDDEEFQARVSTLKNLIGHHVEEEEEALFPKVDEELAVDENASLGKQMKIVFEDMVKRGYAAALSEGDGTTADRAERRVLGRDDEETQHAEFEE